MPDTDLMRLADRIVAVIENGKQQLAIDINRTIKSTYWNVGRYIVEFEQQGNAKAKYGMNLLSNLARILRARVGRGYSRPNLNNMRKFYVLFPNISENSESPICQMSDKLTWSHICELITIEDSLEREFYLKECVSEGWNVETLHRQKESGLFLRLALSKDKKGILPCRFGVLSPHLEMFRPHRHQTRSRETQGHRPNEYVYGIFCQRRKC